MSGRRKRTNLEKAEGIQNILEARGKFDFDYIPFAGKWIIPDGNYRYRQKFPHNIFTGFILTVLKLLAPLYLKIAYGAKVVGKENLKSLKKSGAICVCNHFSFLDTLFVRQATGYFRSLHTMTENNNKTGIAGAIIRHAAMLPFSSNYTAMSNLVSEMDRLIKKGKIINFYAERAMWENYQKPRPMKEGAFSLAVKFGCPVLPIFCTFEKSKRRHVRKLRIHVLPPVYPNGELNRKARAKDMKLKAESAWKSCYEEAYKKPLEYL